MNQVLRPVSKIGDLGMVCAASRCSRLLLDALMSCDVDLDANLLGGYVL